MISLILIFGCLCRSSSWWLRIVFFMGMIEPPKKFGWPRSLLGGSRWHSFKKLRHLAPFEASSLHLSFIRPFCRAPIGKSLKVLDSCFSLPQSNSCNCNWNTDCKSFAATAYKNTRPAKLLRPRSPQMEQDVWAFWKNAPWTPLKVTEVNQIFFGALSYP